MHGDVSFALKGKPGKDLIQFAGTFDHDILKAMEEAAEYDCERVEADGQ
jgi:hypothetical protein